MGSIISSSTPSHVTDYTALSNKGKPKLNKHEPFSMKTIELFHKLKEYPIDILTDEFLEEEIKEVFGDKPLTFTTRFYIDRIIEILRYKNDCIHSLVPVHYKDCKDKEQPCYICLDTFKKHDRIMKTHCNHLYHSECLTTWIDKPRPRKHKTTCPYCQQQL